MSNKQGKKQDKTFRYLQRMTYEEIHKLYVDTINGKIPCIENFYETHGWTDKEYWAEGSKRKHNSRC